MYGKLICNLYALLCWQNFILVNSGCYRFPASEDEVRRFGARARKIFLRDPPFVLQKLFAQVVAMGRDDGPSNRRWKRCSEEERDAGYGQGEEEV
jgi:hypothetical protein